MTDKRSSQQSPASSPKRASAKGRKRFPLLGCVIALLVLAGIIYIAVATHRAEQAWLNHTASPSGAGSGLVDADESSNIFDYNVGGVADADDDEDAVPTAAPTPSGPTFAIGAPLVDIELAPAEAPLTVPVNEVLSLTVPPAVLAGGGRLSISPARNQRPDLCGTFESLALVDVSLERDGAFVHELPEPIEMTVRFDPAELDPALPPEEQLLAARWDADRALWVELEATVDAQQGLIVARTPHLSVQGWIRWTGIMLIESVRYHYNQVFRIQDFRLYIAPDMSGGLPTHLAAVPATYPAISNWRDDPTAPAGYEHLWAYQHPKWTPFVRDVAYYLEQSYAAYKRVDLKPAADLPVKVEVGPGKAGKDPCNYDHRALRLYLSSDKVTSFKPELRRKLAHELFHAIQNVDLEGDDAKVGAEEAKWWIEASADYAACRIAWPDDWAVRDGMGGGSLDSIYPYLLERPLTEAGKFACPHRWPDVDEIEYDRGYLLDYMAQRGVAFAPLYKAVMARYRDAGQTLEGLEAHLAAQAVPLSFGDLYRGYAGWFLLGETSPRGRSTEPEPLNSTPDRRAAELSAGQPLALPLFKLAAPYTAISRAVRLEPKTKEAQTIEVLATALDAWALVDIYLLPDGARTPNPSPVATLKDTQTPAQMTLAPGQTLYVVALNLDNAREATAAVELRPGPSDWYKGWLAAGPPKNGKEYVYGVDDMVVVYPDSVQVHLAALNYEVVCPGSVVPSSKQNVTLHFDKKTGEFEPTDGLSGIVANKGRRIELTYTWGRGADIASGSGSILPSMNSSDQGQGAVVNEGCSAGSQTVMYSIPIAEPGK